MRIAEPLVRTTEKARSEGGESLDFCSGFVQKGADRKRANAHGPLVDPVTGTQEATNAD